MLGDIRMLAESDACYNTYPQNMTDDTEDPSAAQVKGGLARAESLTPEERSKIARIAAESRWQNDDKPPHATHEGVLTIGGIEIACAVLEDGRRVLTQSGFMRALGRSRQAKGRQYYDADVNMPAFLTAKNLKPFIDKALEVTSTQIIFRRPGGGLAFGYPAEILPSVCLVFLDAMEAGALLPAQQHVADRAKILYRGLAKIGIVALVDEATGYQEVRDRKALQEILDLYLRTEFAAWAKRFPDEFYQQIYRLKGWKWPGMAKNRVPLVGKYTNDLVYERLARGILDELQERNPKDERGKRRAKHHQWLTDGIGHPRLAEHLYGLIGLMRAFPDGAWVEFKQKLQLAYPKKDSNLDIFIDRPANA
jgi:hypothetical protein